MPAGNPTLRTNKKYYKPITTVSTASTGPGEEKNPTGSISGRLSLTAPAALHQSLLSLVDDSADYVGMSDREGNLIYINRAGREMLGLAPDTDISTMKAGDFFTPEGLTYIQQEVIPGITATGRWKGTIHVRHLTSGEIIPFHASYIRIDDPVTGQFAGRGATLRDLRPEIAARQALINSEHQLRTAIEMAELGTWSINLATMEVYFSEKIKDLFGFSGEHIDFNLGILAIHEKDRDRVVEKLQKVLNPQMTGSYEDIFSIRNQLTGRDSTVRVRGKVSFHEDGTAYLITGTLLDITEQKVMERALEQQVLRRTEELKASNTHLSRTNQELEQFAFVASHDLQEPLRKIRTFSGLLEERSGNTLDEGARTYLSKIKSASERMSRLITDLLDFSRVSSKSELRMPVDLNGILQKIEEDFELVIKQKNAVIDAQQLPVIEAVPLQMNQLFYNLLSNSLKFTREGIPPLIRIRARRIAPREASRHPDLGPRRVYWAIDVSDNGIGFDPILSEKIFTIFQRLNPRNQYEGTGIGLALCKKIVMSHGGTIYATAQPLQGATFHILLPVKHS